MSVIPAFDCRAIPYHRAHQVIRQQQGFALLAAPELPAALALLAALAAPGLVAVLLMALVQDLTLADWEQAMLARLDAVKWDMLEEWSKTKRAPKHAEWMHSKELSDV